MQQVTSPQARVAGSAIQALPRKERRDTVSSLPVRVCFVIDELALAGTESQLLALIRRLDRRRVWPYLCLLRGDKPMSLALEPDDCPILRLDIGSLRHPRTLPRMWRFWRFLCRERIDVVQTYFADSSYFGIPMAWLAGVPQRIRTRNNVGHWLTPLHRRLGRLLNLFTTRTIVNCAAARQALLAAEQPRSETVLVLENGVDLERFGGVAPLTERPARKAAHVGVVANLRSVKALEVFVRAAALIHARYPGANFTIAGEGELRPALERQVVEEGLLEQFSLPGSVDDVPEFLAGLDVAVLCSHAEGMSNSLLEYMAAGRAIVATRVGAAPELIADGVHGLLVPPGDARQLADAIQRLLEDRELAQRLGAAARRRAFQHYNREAMVRRFTEFYEGLGDATRSVANVRSHAERGNEILTDIPGKPGGFWGENTRFVGPSKPPTWLLGLAGKRWAYNLTGLLAGVRLFARRRHCQGVVTDGGSSGMIFAWLQTLCPWGRKPHVLIDCLWYLPASPLRAWFKKLRIRLAARSVRRFVVWASHEVEDFARAFALPPWQLKYVPFHHTLHDYHYEVRDEGYLFTGGNFDRDYRTLIEAVRPLDVPVWIASTQRDVLADVELPAHVRVQGTTAEGFRQAMAGAKLTVVAMQPGLLHSGGQQTCLNAMLLGKPTIAVGRRWAVDFISDGEDGLIVDYEDPHSLRRAIRWVLDHPEAARRMGARARERAAWFTTERCMRTVHDLVTEAAGMSRLLSAIARPHSRPEIAHDVCTSSKIC
ncbi:MAG: glycosyltransferase [Gemmataceae bacterium]